MLATKHITKLVLAIGLGAALISSASSPSMARSVSTSDRAAHHATERPAMHSTNRTAPPTNGGPYYYEGSDNGSVWSYYPGYKPLT